MMLCLLPHDSGLKCMLPATHEQCENDKAHQAYIGSLKKSVEWHTSDGDLLVLDGLGHPTTERVAWAYGEFAAEVLG